VAVAGGIGDARQGDGGGNESKSKSLHDNLLGVKSVCLSGGTGLFAASDDQYLHHWSLISKGNR
jgi:hypothetical protein